MAARQQEKEATRHDDLFGRGQSTSFTDAKSNYIHRGCLCEEEMEETLETI